jgi:diacylglycerol kinase family enzyme
MASKFSSIKVRRIDLHSKPAVVIYNPNSGTKTNLIPLITQKLNSLGIEYELMLTQKALDPYIFA